LIRKIKIGQSDSSIYYSDHYRFTHFIKLIYCQQFLFTLLILNLPLFSQAIKPAESDPLAEIIFFANLNGNIEYCQCPAKNTGGMDRIASFISSYRKKSPDVIVIDGGDFFNSYPFDELNAAVIQMHGLIRPDILVAGDQELINAGLLSQLGEVHGQRLLSTNIMVDNRQWPLSLTQSTRDGKTIIFLSYLDKSAFDFVSQPEALKIDHSRFVNAYQAAIKMMDVIRVVVYHGSEENLHHFVAAYPGIDLLLQAHDQSNRNALTVQPAIIGGGSDGDSLVHIQVCRPAGRICFQVKKIAVTTDIAILPEAAAIVQRFKDNLKNKRGK
jgi:2',3'-cyclic-nucleotide 2'-phosphodiesterase (5'-nucleotidase family)